MASKFKAVGAHIYAGGFTLGVRKFFDVLAHLEEWTFGTETVKKNMPSIPITIGVEKWTAEAALIRAQEGPIAWLYGNPPCAGWSGANPKGTGRDEYAKCTERVFGLIDDLDPTVFTWESVAAAVKKGAGFISGQVDFCVKRGYHVYIVLLDGQETGLPQRRKRMFFVASKVHINWKRPNGKRRTVRDAIGHIKDPGPRANESKVRVDIVKTMPKGEGNPLHKYFTGSTVPDPKTGKVKGRPPFVDCRLGWDEVSYTVPGGACLWHPEEPRHLSVLEQQLVCGYPADYEFVGAIGQKYAQIGKAVLPPVAEWLAKQVKTALEEGVPAVPGFEMVDFLVKLDKLDMKGLRTEAENRG